ncbi:uncharacterized protein LOC120816343 [Gasterosteus aculeatus]
MNRGNGHRYGTDAPRCGAGPPPKTYHLKQALTRANEEVFRLTELVKDLEYFKTDAEIEKNSFYLVIKDGRLATARLEKSLQTANKRIKTLEEKMAQEQLVSHQEKERMVQEHEDEHADQVIKYLNLFKKNEELSLSLADAKDELVTNEIWRRKYEVLEKKTNQDIALKQEALEALQVKYQGMATEVENPMCQKTSETLKVNEEMQSENLHLLERLRVQEEKMAEVQLISHQEKERMVQEYEAKLSDQNIQNQALEALQVKYQEMATEVENLMVQKLSETLKVNKEKESILHKLRETEQQLISEEEKFKDLETRVCKELNLKQEMSETRVTQLYSDNLALEEKLNKQQANNHQLEAEYKLLTDWRDGMADKQKHQEENRSLKLQQMEEMAKENQILITKVKQLQDENTLLENICLDLKKKKRGIFGRRMQERQVEMDKMKQKMQDRETKRSEKEEKKGREEKKTFQG